MASLFAHILPVHGNEHCGQTAEPQPSLARSGRASEKREETEGDHLPHTTAQVPARLSAACREPGGGTGSEVLT